ncbi:MAG: cyclic nucleotide-binding domain-containing protein [bacterium]
MFIKEAELFHDIPSHIIDEIAAVAEEEILPAGQVVFRAGEVAESLYILEDGWVNLAVGGAGLLSMPVSPGDVFGWSALVEPNQYTASAECRTESTVIKVDANRLMHILEKHPAEGFKVMRRLAGLIASRLLRSYQEIVGSRETSQMPSYG